MLTRVYPASAPFADFAATIEALPGQCVPEWPARWLSFPLNEGFGLYRLVLNLEQPLQTRIHLTADESYEFYINGALLARGPERSDPANWAYESFDLALPQGRHVLLIRIQARVTSREALTIRPGLLLAAEAEGHLLLTTGQAPWDFAPQSGISFSLASEQDKLIEDQTLCFTFDCAKLQPDWRRGAGSWTQIVSAELPLLAQTSLLIDPTRHALRPSALKPCLFRYLATPSLRFAAREDIFAKPDRPVEEKKNDKNLQFTLAPVFQGKEAIIPPKTTLRAIIDLQQYTCHHPSLDFSGGKRGKIRLRYAQALQDREGTSQPGPHDAIDNKVFRGFADLILADGQPHQIVIPARRAGRFVQVEIRTAGEPLLLKRMAFAETRYDLGDKFSLESNLPHAAPISTAALRTLQVCAHDQLLETPAAQPLHRIGALRLQLLAGYLIDPDSALARKTLLQFDASRANPSGLPLASYPSPGVLIPPDALWWVAMIADYARWRGDLPLIKRLLPAARHVIERFIEHVDSRGLLQSPRGWNYIDAAQGFEQGVPPGAKPGGRSCVLQWHLVYTLRYLSDLEDAHGNPAFAKQWRIAAENLADTAETYYWDKKRQLFADDLEHTSFSQHAQILAVLGRALKRDRSQQILNRTLRDTHLIQAGVEFSHYLFEALAPFDHGQHLRTRLSDWSRPLAEGYTTFPANFSQPRYDCHGPSAHILYQMLTTLVGIHPEGWNLDSLRLEPHLLTGEHVKVSVAHPRGMMKLELAMTDEGLIGKGHVPRGVKIAGGGRNVSIQQG